MTSHRIVANFASILLLSTVAATASAANSSLDIAECWAADAQGSVQGPLIIEGSTDFLSAAYAEVSAANGESSKVPLTAVLDPVLGLRKEFRAILTSLTSGDSYVVVLRTMKGAVIRSKILQKAGLRVAPAKDAAHLCELVAAAAN